MRSGTTSTRRGLVLTFYADVLMAAGMVAFLGLSLNERLLGGARTILVWGVLLSGFLGLFALAGLWAGRREFGPAHEKSVRRGMLFLGVLAAFLVLAFFQLSTGFTDPKTGGRLANLRAPWFFLGAAILADVAAIRFVLQHLVDERGRKWIWISVATAVAGDASYGVLGWLAIEDYIRRVGPVAENTAVAESFLNDFTLDIIRPWVLVLLLMRVGFWSALLNAAGAVAEAEQEAFDEAPAVGTAP